MKIKKATIHCSRLALAAVIGGVWGCETPPEATERLESAVVGAPESPSLGPYLVKRYNDCKGKVESAVWVCFARGPAQFHQVTCRVGDPSYVAVGGGAEVRGWNDNLAKSFLVDTQLPFGFGYNFDTFRAASKAHPNPHEHSLYTYVLGLKIAGITRAQIIGNLQVHRASTGPSFAPEIWSQVPADRLLLSAGLNLKWSPGSGFGQLLAGSWAGASGGWGVSTRMVEQYFSAALDGYGLSLPRNLLGVSLKTIEVQDSRLAEGGSASVTVTAPRAALTHAGGWAYGDGRAILSMGPNLNDGRQVMVASTSPLNPAAGSTFAVALGLSEVYSGPQGFCVPPL